MSTPRTSRRHAARPAAGDEVHANGQADGAVHAADEVRMLALGRRIRELRTLRQMTLKVAAESAGISEGFLSQVERGLARPSVASLHRVAEVLDVSIIALFDEAYDRPGAIVRANERVRVTMPGAQWDLTLLTPPRTRHLQVSVSHVDAGHASGDAMAFEGREAVIVLLSGQLHFWLNETMSLLERGDAITFDPATPHRYENPGPTPTEALWIVTPPYY